MFVDKPAFRLQNLTPIPSSSHQLIQKRKVHELAKLPSIPNFFNQNSSIANNGLVSSKPPLERSPSIPSKPSMNVLESLTGKGPKIYNKNLPDVFFAKTPRQKLSQKNLLESRRKARPHSSRQNSFDGKFLSSINHSDQSRDQDHSSPSQKFNDYKSNEKSDSFSQRSNHGISIDPLRPIYTEESKKDNSQINLKFEYYSESHKFVPRAIPAHLQKVNNAANQISNYCLESSIQLTKHQSNESINVPSKNLEGELKHHIAFQKIICKIPKSSRFATKYEELSIKKVTKASHPPLSISLQLHELVTLKKLKETSNNGILKRMLHVPTFRMIDIQQEPISELGSRENKQLKEWVDLWKVKFSKSRHLGHIYWTFWNSPEGCVSIATESARNGFLSDLVNNNVNLPEKCIQEIAKSLVNGIHEIHTKINRSHGNIKIEEIMITRKGTVKLLPGTLTGFLNIAKSQENTNFENNNKNIFQDQAKKVHSRNDSLINAKRITNDLFDLGLTLLQCAIGNLSFFDIDNILTIENIKAAWETFNFQRTGSRCCCLLHSESFVRKVIGLMKSSTQNEDKYASLNKSPRKDKENQNSKTQDLYLPLIDILRLNNRFSQEFENFLCCCLQLDSNQTIDTTRLMDHKFLQSDHRPNGPLCSLEEMLKVKKGEKNMKDQSEKQLEKLNELLRVGFLDKIVKEKFNRMLGNSPRNDIDEVKMFDLAKELDVPVSKLKKIVNEYY